MEIGRILSAAGGFESRMNIRLWTACLLFAVGLFIAAPAQSQLYERYLRGHHGPYKGRVIDAETKRPLHGAVVLAVWDREIPLVIQSNTVFYAAREVLTDINGEFVITAKDIEADAPSRTLRPRFVIFFPGYGYYPNYQVAPTGFIGGNFEGKGTLVELPKLKAMDDRLAVVDKLPPVLVPYEKMPNLLQFLNTERVNLGLQPLGK
jgi:hypothetical protein